MGMQWFLASIVLWASCMMGAACGFKRLKSPPRPGEDSAQLRLTGSLTGVTAVPITAPVLTLNVPLNSFVKKGQAIGVSEGDTPAEKSMNADSQRNLAEAYAAVEAARDRLCAIESDLAAARAGADEVDSEVRSAEEEAHQAGYAAQASDRRFRQGLESELVHEHTQDMYGSARNREETLRSRAVFLKEAIDGMEARRGDAQTDVREATDELNAAKAAVLSVPSRARQVIAPSDGYLTVLDERLGTLAIASNLEQRVETYVNQKELAQLRPGMPATVMFAEQPERAVRAIVESIGEAGNAAARGTTTPVTLSLLDPGKVRTSDSPVTIVIPLPGR